ncbi:MAG: UMP kinase [Candidatus Caldarchaeum sp.]|nr:UMP kinase [Candidatus Caldarchaeum sp.]MDW8063132.1 UMP kinase [Candidatus Caldarchaeum sp.]
MNVVLKLGGSVVFGDEIHVDALKGYAGLLGDVFDGGRWVVVVGGGGLARRYIEAGRKIGLDEASCDEAAIKITRIHAYLLARAIGDKAVQTIPSSVDDIRFLTGFGKIVVSGGLTAGQSTMAVSVHAASVIKAERVVVASDVDGVYSDDPKKNPDAKLIPRMTFEEFAEIGRRISQLAGHYQVVDAVGLAMALRTRIPLYYVNGHRLEDVREALLGRGAGTIVSD